MYAYDYANRNFKYSYKGNYNNIFLFNDNKPNGFEVFPNTPNNYEYYLPVKIHDSNPDIVVPLIDDHTYDNFLEQIGNDLEGIVDIVISNNSPQILLGTIVGYLIKTGYMVDSGIIKSLGTNNENTVEKNIYVLDDIFYVLAGESNQLEEVVLRSTKPTGNIKPFIDFDEELDKQNNQVIIMVSSDGAKIDDAYLNTDKVNANEIILYIEDITGSNIFGSAVRVRTGSNVKKLTSDQLRIVKNLLVKMDLEINETKIAKILDKHIHDSKENDSIIYYIKRGFLGISSIVSVVANIPLSVIGAVSETIINGIENNLKLKENRWKYYTSKNERDEKFDAFLPIDAFLKSEAALNKKQKEFTTSCFDIVDAKIKAIEQTLYNKISGINKTLANAIKPFFKTIFKGFKSVRKLLKDVINGIVDYSLNKLLYLNGLVVGIINSILDTVVFIFQLLKFLFNPESNKKNTENALFNTKATISMFLEIVENAKDIITKLFTETIFNAIKKFEKKIQGLLLKTIINPSSIDFTLPKADKVGYYTGFAVGFIIEEVIAAMLSAGTLNVAKATQLAIKGMKETLQGIKAIPKKIGEAFSTAAQKGNIQLIKLMEMVKTLITDLPKLLDDIADWLAKLLLKAEAYLEVVYKKVFNSKSRERLKRANLHPTNYDELTDTFTFCPIKR